MAEQFIREHESRMLEEYERFRTAIQDGIAAADTGEFVEHAEVWANVEEILRTLR